MAFIFQCIFFFLQLLRSGSWWEAVAYCSCHRTKGTSWVGHRSIIGWLKHLSENETHTETHTHWSSNLETWEANAGCVSNSLTIACKTSCFTRDMWCISAQNLLWSNNNTSPPVFLRSFMQESLCSAGDVSTWNKHHNTITSKRVY